MRFLLFRRGTNNDPHLLMVAFGKSRSAARGEEGLQ